MKDIFKEKYLFSGEIHYFRIEKEKWDFVLEKARKANLNTVSTYVPWCFHEQKEGEIDFEGKTNPKKDLITFIEKVFEKDLKLILRIGPISNAELVREGIPEWLLKKHPDILTEGKGAENLPHTTLISYLNRNYLKYVDRWYEKVLKIVKDYQNKPIVLVQLCNEIGMSHWVNKTPDLSNFVTELYQKYLKKKYKTIKKLNNYYGTKFKKFSQISQPIYSKNLKVIYDWGMFYREIYFPEYFKYLKNRLRRVTDLRIIINIPQFFDYDIRARGFYSPVTTSFYKNFNKFEKNITFGGAYQLRRLDYENFQDVFIATEAVNMINKNNPNICAEIQTGIMRDRPRLYPDIVEAHLKTALATGLKGLNCYMFAGGNNPNNLGMFGKYHDWQSPVGNDLKLKAHYNTVADFGQFLSTWGKFLKNTKKKNFLSFAFYQPIWSGEFSDIPQIEHIRSRYFFDGIARLFLLNNYHFDFVDVEKDIKNIKNLFFLSKDFVDERIQQKLINFVKKGGNLIIGPELPKEFLKALKIIKKEGSGPICFKEKECYVEGKVEVYKGLKDFDVVARDKNGEVSSFIKKYGKGKIFVYGFAFVHYFDFQKDIVKDWLKKMNVNLPFNLDSNEIIVSLLNGKKGSFICLFNYHHEYYNVRFRYKNLDVNIDLFPQQLKILPYNIKFNKNIRIYYSTSEILKIEGNKIFLKGNIGEKGEIKLKIDNKNKKIHFRFNKEKIVVKI